MVKKIVETQEFISKYFRSGNKRRRLESNCFVSFNNGAKKELVLFGSDKKIIYRLSFFPHPEMNFISSAGGNA
jgi:hypothetical protein